MFHPSLTCETGRDEVFDETKAGVKRPADELANESTTVDSKIPVIDLTDIESEEKRKVIVEQVKRASKEWGLFRVVNHGIPVYVLECMLDGIRMFSEQDAEVKMEFHSTDVEKMVRYGTKSRDANYRRETLIINRAFSDSLVPHALPEICSWAKTLFELLSESLGLKPDYLGSIECGKGLAFLGHYYPPHPGPHLVIGTSKHTDPSIITINLQDQIGGLQVLHDNQYVNIPPVAGSLVVNIGDMLQIMSNDEYKSAAHRVVSKQEGPRISVAGLFTCDSVNGKIYGPIPELISEERPPLYKEFTAREYIYKYLGRANSGLDYFKLQG